uniref:Secreted protein n=1 Tax=Globodera pallida TaxID=36090 RepID=A0A183CFA7_GLOPA
MATTTFLLLTLRPFTASLLIMALLFNGRCCWAADVLALQDYACAKKDAKLPMGFNLAKDDQLLMDPFGLSNGDTNTTIQPQIRVLLVNPKEVELAR